MKLKYIICVLLITFFIPAIVQAEENTNSRWINGNLIYYANDNRMEWIDGIGQNVVVFKEDFNTPNFDSLGMNVKQLSRWTWFCADSGLQYYPIVNDTSGVIRLDYGGADNDSVVMRAASEFFYTDTLGTTPFSMRIRFYVGDTTQSEFKIGLLEEGVDITGTSKSGIYLRNLDETNKVVLEVNRGGSVDTVTAISNLAVDTWYEVVIYGDGSGGIYGFVNGTALTKITKYTPRTTRLTPTAIWKNGAAYASHKYAYIDDFDVIFVKP